MQMFTGRVMCKGSQGRKKNIQTQSRFIKYWWKKAGTALSETMSFNFDFLICYISDNYDQTNKFSSVKIADSAVYIFPLLD